ncbi:hypothetical protein VNO80_05936 [Phaseolus coccineus]|uniref:Uncharacterized protein n=1 Tax=Phaseolus coccineus TaxID=3886 RepID=A0AAN9NG08_PHACN
MFTDVFFAGIGSPIRMEAKRRRVLDNREKNDVFEALFKTKASDFQVEKVDKVELKVESSDELDHPAYFKKVDKVEVKVESSDELDHPAYFKKVDKVEVKVESSDELDHPAYFKKVDKVEVKVESSDELDKQG